MTAADPAERAERRAAVAEERAEGAFLRLAQATAEAARLGLLAEQREQAVADLEQALAEMGRREADALRQAALAEQERAEAAGWVAAMRRSTSWRVTEPLRRIGAIRRRGELPLLIEAAPDEIPDEIEDAAPEPASPAADPPAGPFTAVHQFHSGSAAGDAITNAMLVTRDLLRGMGYDSRIFAEHRGPGLPEVHGIDELPQHHRYALIVRHSMGHDALPRILALPVPKVLIYHNITPPELLADSPFLRQYARKGREQLAELRPAVAAALADSEYNALELRQAGFGPVSACPLLFDVDAMLARAGRPARGPVFTVLFVGRVTRSKGQLELVAAYARFRADFPGESRLVLVGRHGGADDPYMAELSAFIARRPVAGVEIAGLVTDEALRRHYAEADLYVSLSQHEGFGVPLVEAMVAGVPVLAWPAGAVPYTLGGAAALLDDRTVEGAAGRMLDLARDPAARAAIAERQLRSLHRFKLERQAPVLAAALARAGVAPPTDRAALDALAANMHFTVAGHVNGTYSLAEVNRAMAAAIEARRPGAVRLLPVEGEVTTNVQGVPAEQREAVRTLLARPAPETAPTIVISQHYPVWTPHEPGDLALALFYWEESLVPAQTVATLNAGFGGVLAPTRTVAKALIDSGVQAPVRVLAQAPRLDRFRALRASRAGREGAFTFLHVSSCFPRKGVDALLAAYAAAFRRTDRVRLVIKGFPNLHNTVAAQLARLRADDPEAPAIELIDTDLDEAALLGLYRDADAMVLPTRGEGFNLPAAEALAAGLPLIVTGHGGHMDFVGQAPPGAVRLLRYRLAASGSHLASAFSLWAEPDVDDLAAALREAVERGRVVVPPAPLGNDDVAGDLGRIAAELLLAPAAPAFGTPAFAVPAFAAAWVTTWGVRCGVAGYAQQLVAAMPGAHAVLADIRSEAAVDVHPVWRLGEARSVADLSGAILRMDPPVVVVQHQPGLLPWGVLASLLTAPALQGRVVCAALHNTRHLMDVPAAERAATVRALAGISRVVVHTVHDVNRLAGLGLEGNVTLIPQGAPAPGPPRPPAAGLGADAAVVIGCYGFFLPGKGIAELIGALAVLRRRWPLARLRLVNAEYPGPESAYEIARCRRLAAAAGLQDAVEFMTGFLDDADSMALLAGCDLVVLPYQGSKEASSAALRSALCAGVAVAVTPLPLFDEASDAVIRLPGTEPERLAAGIGAALLDGRGRAATEAAARAWLIDRNWAAIARRWDGMLRGLLASGVVAGAAVSVAGGRDAPHPVR